MSSLRITVPTEYPAVQQHLPDQPTVPDVIEVIKRWHDTGVAEVLLLLNITESLLSKFEEEWAKCEDFKIKYFWDRHGNVLTVSMPTALHECMVPYLSDETQAIREEVRHTQTCKPVSVEMSGAPTCDTKGRWRLEPDAGFRIKYGEDDYYQSGFPTVVMEVVLSNNTQWREKCWNWLWKTDLQVQAVVVYEMTYPVSDVG
ncbi:hypothetical protein FRC06_001667, partial [Ceratobasidium sp. 370]